MPAGRSTPLWKAWPEAVGLPRQTAPAVSESQGLWEFSALAWPTFVQGSALGGSVPGVVPCELLVTACVWVSLCFGPGWRAWVAQWAEFAARCRGTTGPSAVGTQGRRAGLEERPLLPVTGAAAGRAPLRRHATCTRAAWAPGPRPPPGAGPVTPQTGTVLGPTGDTCTCARCRWRSWGRGTVQWLCPGCGLLCGASAQRRDRRRVLLPLPSLSSSLLAHPRPRVGSR